MRRSVFSLTLVMLSSLFLYSCCSKYEKVGIGMTKSEVLSLLGSPDIEFEMGKGTTLKYRCILGKDLLVDLDGTGNVTRVIRD